MIEGKKWMTISYQIVSQAIFAYFLLYLVADWLSLSFALGAYSAVIVGGLVTLLLTSYYHAYQIRVFVVPLIIFAISFFTGLYWLIGIALAGAMIWKYQSLEIAPDYGNENTLLMSTTIIAYAELIFYQDLQLLVALVVQYVVLLGGYNLSHYFEVPRADRSKGKRMLSIYALAIPITVLVLTLLFPGARKVLGFLWEVISFVFLKGFMGLLDALAFFGMDVSGIQPSETEKWNQGGLFEELKNANNQQYEAGKYDPTVANAIGEATHWGVIIGIISAVIIGLAIVYRFNKNQGAVSMEDEELVYQNVQWSAEGTGTFRSGMTFHRSKADNEIRKHFQQFEINAAKIGVGRGYNESIDEWFERLGVAVEHTNLYKRVRYGAEELSIDEKERFYQEMNELMEEIKDVAEKKDTDEREN